ncbi:MAG: chromosomal replication initiator protein DnaA [Bacteroides sp.]|nr:chromosomal replication initiator protein DnaA [Bacteroides sp.]MCM1457600.1 chromosomal replication initiator protein DnaA [Lachnoclostridium sp.]
MTSNDHIQLWEQCKAFIKDNLDPHLFEVWFEPITSFGFDSNMLTLMLPSSFFVEQLEERFIKLFRSAVDKVYGPGTQIYYRYIQVQNQPDTAVSQRSTTPSATILNQQHAQAANPFRAQPKVNFDPQLNPRYTFENYCGGESNKVAIAIAEAIAANPHDNAFNPLFLFGSTGVGKTHLIQAIGIRIKENNPDARVLYVTARLFESQYTAAVAKGNTNSFFLFYQSIDTLIIDDIQDLGGNKPKTQNTLFHIFNHLHQNNRQIIMSSDCPPSEMEGFEARMLGRFKRGMIAELERPDIELRRNVLVRKAEQDGLEIPREVIDFVAENVTDSIRELEGIMVSLVAHATVLNCDITLDLAKRVLAHAVKSSRKAINFEVITEHVCSYYQIDSDLLFTKSRKREISDARQVVMYLAKTMAKMPLVAIGNRLDRTHATVNYACKSIDERLPHERQLQADLDAIRASITQA